MNNGKIHVLCVLPMLGHPLYSKRIAMLQEQGYLVEAVAFERTHPGGRLPPCPTRCLGVIRDEQYLKRILKFITTLPTLRRAIRRNTVIYMSGSDIAMLSAIASLGMNKILILEVADIQKIQVAGGWRGWLVRLLERCALKRCRLLVVTAPGFVDGYYRKWLHSDIETMLIENKLDGRAHQFSDAECRSTLRGIPLVDRPLRIGYFGVLRCDWSWRVLEALAAANTRDLRVVVAGYATRPADLSQRAAKLANVEVRGPYTPMDLPSLYKDVDLVWACYPSPENRDSKWYWAQAVCRSNRFYESCFFKKPIISIANNGDSVEVERYEIGIVIRNPDIIEIWKKLSSITPNDWIQLQSNLAQLPASVYMYTTEGADLSTAIRRMMAESALVGDE